jgi:hypothetical protein
MKKSLTLATVVVALGYSLVLISRLAGFTSLNFFSFPALIGGVFSIGLLLMAFSDYSRKPRFRAGRTRQATRGVTTPATAPKIDPASAWTYMTIST